MRVRGPRGGTHLGSNHRSHRHAERKLPPRRAEATVRSARRRVRGRPRRLRDRHPPGRSADRDPDELVRGHGPQAGPPAARSPDPHRPPDRCGDLSVQRRRKTPAVPEAAGPLQPVRRARQHADRARPSEPGRSRWCSSRSTRSRGGSGAAAPAGRVADGRPSPASRPVPAPLRRGGGSGRPHPARPAPPSSPPAELAAALGTGRASAQKMAYCLRANGLFEPLRRTRSGVVYRVV